MQYDRYAVLIPGIMGSELRFGNHVIWGEDFGSNYKTLITNPGELRWNGNRAEAALLKRAFVRVPYGPPIMFVRLWHKLLTHLCSHRDFARAGRIREFAYDWRASLLETAEVFASWLGSLAGENIAYPPATSQVRFVLLAHSMGGLLARAALGRKLVHPSWLDRIVHIGSPLQGSAAAFATAYGELGLPFFAEIFRLTRWKSRGAFNRHLLECMQSFPAIYQLFPPRPIPYLFHSLSVRTNPLDEPCMRADARQFAAAAHAVLADAAKLMIISNVRSHSLYTAVHSKRETQQEFRVQPLPPGCGYTILEVTGRTMYGDGTVAAESACGGPSCSWSTVLNVDHAFLCNSTDLVSNLQGLLDG
jgi:hypothetical protein